MGSVTKSAEDPWMISILPHSTPSIVRSVCRSCVGRFFFFQAEDGIRDYKVTGVQTCALPISAGTFYAFPDVSAICRRLAIQSHGLAMYLLEGADDHFGVACLGGECFGPAGQGFLRFSCAELDERIDQAVAFLPAVLDRRDRVGRYRDANPQFVLGDPYPTR